MNSSHTSLYPVNTSEMLRDGSVYMRTSSLLRADVPVVFPDGTRIRHYSQADCDALQELLRRRSVFSRHGVGDFYYRQAAHFVDTTVIELARVGSPNEIFAAASHASNVAERVTLLAATLVAKKSSMLRDLGVGQRIAEVELVRAPGLGKLKSRTTQRPRGGGVVLDRRLAKRVCTAGFATLFSQCVSASAVGNRLDGAVGWLAESRRELRREAAVVKTSIALESLLIFTESESLAGSLSERAAFLLASQVPIRRRISHVIKRFYDVRSGVVHGSKKKRRGLNEGLLDGVDRLTALALVTIAASADKWASVDSLREWFEDERWGKPQQLVRPFTATHLKNAVSLAEK